MTYTECFFNNEIRFCKFNGYLAVGNGVNNYLELSTKYSGKIRIPASVDGVPVKEISPYAFFRCNLITSVYIEKGITKICEGSFGDCYSLVDINVPSTVESIGNCGIHFWNWTDTSNHVSTGICMIYFEKNYVLKSLGNQCFAYKDNVILVFENPIRPQIGPSCLNFVSNPKIISPIPFNFNGIRSSPRVLTKHQHCRSSFSMAFMISLMVIVLSP